MTGGWVPDYSLDAPEGHTWMSPPPADCPDCPCCTLALCHQAQGKGRACWHLVTGGLDAVTLVTGCPCSVAVEVRWLDGLRDDVLATARAYLADHPAPPDDARAEGPVPAAYGDDPARVYLLVTPNPAGGDRVKVAAEVVRAATASGYGRKTRHAWIHGLVLLESAPAVVNDLVLVLAAASVPAGVGDGQVPAVQSTHQLTAAEGRRVHAVSTAKFAEIWGHEG